MRQLLLVLALVFSAHLARSGPIGAVVQTWHYDPSSNTVNVRIVNVSAKDITAWNLKIKETYQGNQVKEHELYTDLLPLKHSIEETSGTTEGESLRQQYGNGTFQAGTSRDQVLHVEPGLTDCKVEIDTVVYADNTTETTNRAALDRAIAYRKVSANTLQAANLAIEHALANPADKAPHETAIKEIEKISSAWKAQRHTDIDLDTALLESVVRDLRNASRSGQDMNALMREYSAKQKQRISTFSDAAVKSGGVK